MDGNNSPLAFSEINPKFALELEKIKESKSIFTEQPLDSVDTRVLQELLKPKEVEVCQKTYLYIMKNKHDGRYKIGVSSKPRHRERTLQSQQPDIELVAKFKGLSHHEKLWHEYFIKEHCRGEWFTLTPTQVNFMVSKCRAEKEPPQRTKQAKLK